MGGRYHAPIALLRPQRCWVEGSPAMTPPTHGPQAELSSAQLGLQEVPVSRYVGAAQGLGHHLGRGCPPATSPPPPMTTWCPAEQSGSGQHSWGSAAGPAIAQGPARRQWGLGGVGCLQGTGRGAMPGMLAGARLQARLESCVCFRACTVQALAVGVCVSPCVHAPFRLLAGWYAPARTKSCSRCMLPTQPWCRAP